MSSPALSFQSATVAEKNGPELLHSISNLQLALGETAGSEAPLHLLLQQSTKTINYLRSQLNTKHDEVRAFEIQLKALQENSQRNDEESANFVSALESQLLHYQRRNEELEILLKISHSDWAGENSQIRAGQTVTIEMQKIQIDELRRKLDVSLSEHNRLAAAASDPHLDLKKEMGVLEGEAERLRQELAIRDHSLRHLSSQKNDGDKLAAVLAKEIEILQKENNTLRDERAATEMSLNLLEAKLIVDSPVSEAFFKQKITELEAEVAALRLAVPSTHEVEEMVNIKRREREVMSVLELGLSEQQKHQEKIRDLEEEKSAMQSLLQTTQQNLLISESSSKDFLKRFEIQSERILSQEKEISHLKSEHASLSEQLKNIENEKSNLNLKCAAASDGVNKLNSSVSFLQIKLDEEKRENSRISTEILEKEKKYLDLEQKAVDERRKFESIESELRRKIDELNLEKGEILRGREECEIALASMAQTQKMNESEVLTHLRKLETDLFSSQNSNENLRRRASTLEDALNEKIQKCRNLEASLRRETAATADSEIKIKFLNIDVEKLRRESDEILQSKNNEIEALSMALANSNSDLSLLRENFKNSEIFRERLARVSVDIFQMAKSCHQGAVGISSELHSSMVEQMKLAEKVADLTAENKVQHSLIYQRTRDGTPTKPEAVGGVRGSVATEKIKSDFVSLSEKHRDSEMRRRKFDQKISELEFNVERKIEIEKNNWVQIGLLLSDEDSPPEGADFSTVKNLAGKLKQKYSALLFSQKEIGKENSNLKIQLSEEVRARKNLTATVNTLNSKIKISENVKSENIFVEKIDDVETAREIIKNLRETLREADGIDNELGKAYREIENLTDTRRALQTEIDQIQRVLAKEKGKTFEFEMSRREHEDVKNNLAHALREIQIMRVELAREKENREKSDIQNEILSHELRLAKVEIVSLSENGDDFVGKSTTNQLDENFFKIMVEEKQNEIDFLNSKIKDIQEIEVAGENNVKIFLREIDTLKFELDLKDQNISELTLAKSEAIKRISELEAEMERGARASPIKLFASPESIKKDLPPLQKLPGPLPTNEKLFAAVKPQILGLQHALEISNKNQEALSENIQYQTQELIESQKIISNLNLKILALEKFIFDSQQSATEIVADIISPNEKKASTFSPRSFSDVSKIEKRIDFLETEAKFEFEKTVKNKLESPALRQWEIIVSQKQTEISILESKLEMCESRAVAAEKSIFEILSILSSELPDASISKIATELEKQIEFHRTSAGEFEKKNAEMLELKNIDKEKNENINMNLTRILEQLQIDGGPKNLKILRHRLTAIQNILCTFAILDPSQYNMSSEIVPEEMKILFRRALAAEIKNLKNLNNQLAVISHREETQREKENIETEKKIQFFSDTDLVAEIQKLKESLFEVVVDLTAGDIFSEKTLWGIQNLTDAEALTQKIKNEINLAAPESETQHLKNQLELSLQKEKAVRENLEIFDVVDAKMREKFALAENLKNELSRLEQQQLELEEKRKFENLKKIEKLSESSAGFDEVKKTIFQNISLVEKRIQIFEDEMTNLDGEASDDSGVGDANYKQMTQEYNSAVALLIQNLQSEFSSSQKQIQSLQSQLSEKNRVEKTLRENLQIEIEKNEGLEEELGAARVAMVSQGRQNANARNLIDQLMHTHTHTPPFSSLLPSSSK